MLESFREFSGVFKEISVTQGTGEAAITVRAAFTDTAAIPVAKPRKVPPQPRRMTAIDSLGQTPPQFDWEQ